MTALNLALALTGVAALALHMIAVALSRALRTYSRSRLEEVCSANHRPERAVAIAHLDQRAERSAEALALLSGMVVAVLLGMAIMMAWTSIQREALVLIPLAIAAAGHLLAGIVGRVSAENVLDSLWPIANLIRRVMAPFIFPARALEALVYRKARGGPTLPRPQSVEVELHTATDLPEEDLEADLPETTRALLERAVELAHRDAGEVMTPRSSILALPATTSALEAANLFTASGRSRIPVFGEHRDDIVGILYAKDLFPALVSPTDQGKPSIRKLARAPMFVPESKNAAELLEDFRASRVQIAVVLDEYGGVSGLITLEDLLEELVGPIDDEHDIPTPSDPVKPLGGTQYEVDAALPLEDLNERLNLNFSTDGDYETVGGLAFDALGRLPEPGATFRRNGVEFTILEVADHSIRRMRVDLQPAETVRQ